MAAMAYPTPAPGAYILEKRQSTLSSIISDISGVFDPATTANDGGSDTTSQVTSDDGSGGTTSIPTTSVSTSESTPPTTTSSRQRTRTSDGGGVTSTADSGSGSGSNNEGNSFVTTQVSTQQGGGTVVIVRTTRSAAGATNTASSDTSSTSSSNGGKIGGIVGGVVGGLALITAAVLLFFLWRRRKSRTGSGYFLCFGRRPDRNKEDFDVNWPTFDPTLGSAAVGGTMGARSGRNNAQGGTLPDIEDGDAYSPDEDMREVGSNGGQSSYGAYYGAGAGAAAAVAPSAYSSNMHTGANSTSYKGPSEEGHYRNGGVGAQGWGAVAPTSDDTAPTYDHLDPPEVREARAREQAQAQAQAMAAYSAGGDASPPFQPAPAYYQSASPPMHNNRLSTGSTQALANGMYMDEGEGTLEPQSDHQQRMLHLHNPDGY